MPGIPVKLIDLNGDLKPQVYGLVDSGADYSTFPTSWAAELGIDLKDCLEHEGETAGGKAPRYLFEPGVHAVVLGRKLHLAACFADCRIVILGREDFFQYFSSSFDQAAETFEVEAASDWDVAAAAAEDAIRRYADNVRAYLDYLNRLKAAGGTALATSGAS